jgi:outer membrane protein assembly factor BamB
VILSAGLPVVAAAQFPGSGGSRPEGPGKRDRAADAKKGPAADPQTLPTEVRWSVAVSVRPSAPPVIGGDKIFLALESGVLVAHRLSDGVEAWRVEMRTDQPIAVDGARVFVASGEAVHALDSGDAAIVWRVPTGTLTAPILVQDGWIVVASAKELAAFRLEDGTRVWGRELGPQHNRPTIEGDNLYVPLDDGRLFALDLRTGTDRWVRRVVSPRTSEAGKGPPALSEVLAYPDRVFLGASDGRFVALHAVDGSLAWRSSIGAVLRGRPVGDGTRVFVAAMDNVVRAFDRGNGALLWHPGLPFRPMGPVLIGTRLVVPGASAEVRAFDVAGRPAGQIKLNASLLIPPAFSESAGGHIMAGVTGSLEGQWLLLVEESRALPIVPLTQLPGVIVPVVLPTPQG